MNFKLLSIVLLGLSLHACYTDSDDGGVLIVPDPQTENTQGNSYPDADQRLWKYYQSFEEEAIKRNIIIDLDALGITGAINDIADDGVAGTCRYGQGLHVVTVDIDYWNRSSEIGREFVVYHELGHCVLGRGHTEQMNAEGLCLSIMASGTGDCRFAYNQINREAYLNELFLDYN